MEWQTVIVGLLLAYAILFWILWSVCRDACDATDGIQSALDRYDATTRKRR